MTQQMQDISADLPFKQFFSKLQEDGVSYRQILHDLIIQICFVFLIDIKTNDQLPPRECTGRKPDWKWRS